MDLEELRDAQANERSSDSLQVLSDSFYEDTAEYIQDLREKRDSFDDPYSDEAQRVNDKVDSARRVVESIYERRVGKVVKMASLAANGHSADEENMTREEREMYNSIVDEIRSNYDRISGVLDGGDSEEEDTSSERAATSDRTGEVSAADGGVRDETETAEKASETREAESSGYKTVRAKESLPEFLGTDGREYELGEEDVARIPEENASALEDSGAVVEIPDEIA